MYLQLIARVSTDLDLLIEERLMSVYVPAARSSSLKISRSVLPLTVYVCKYIYVRRLTREARVSTNLFDRGATLRIYV